MLDHMSAETRARIACRIYLALFDAGDDGAIVAGGATHVPCHLLPEDPNQVGEVLQLLHDAGSVRAADSSHPLHNVLPPDQRMRMESEAPGAGRYVDRLRSELAAYDRGEPVHAEAFTKTEAAIRTGHSGADPL